MSRPEGRAVPAPRVRRAHAHGDAPTRIYDQLRDSIIRGRVRPGERVTEAELALSMGVSRTPVREALNRLTHEGFLVEQDGSRRTQLVAAALTSADVAELWGIMGALEGAALETLDSLGHIRRLELARTLREVNDGYAAAVHAHPRDADLVSVLQSRFHWTLVRACGGPRLRALHRALTPHVERYQWAYGSELRERALALSISEHAAVIRRVERGDGAGARRAIERHWTKATARAKILLQR